MRALFIGSLAAMSLSLYTGCSNSGPSPYEAAVKSQLRDPGSAEFSEVVTNGPVACGFVNSKNGFGGYAGKVPFVVVGDRATIIDSLDGNASHLVNARCGEPARSAINDWIANRAIEALRATM